MEKECCLLNIYGKTWDQVWKWNSKVSNSGQDSICWKWTFPIQGQFGDFFHKKGTDFYRKCINFSFHLCPPPKCVSACWPLEVATSWQKRDLIIVCLLMIRWPVTIILRLIDFFHLFCFTWQGFEGCSWPPLREACQTNRQLLAACCFLGRCKHQLFCYTTNCMSQLS